MNRITDQLWMGDIQDVRTRSLTNIGIDHVITVCQDSVADNVGCDYDHFNMSDGPEEGIVGGDSSFELFEAAVDETVDALDAGDTLLVHCHAGRSRSAMVCTSALAARQELSFEDATELIHDTGRFISPCPGVADHARRYIDEHVFPE